MTVFARLLRRCFTIAILLAASHAFAQNYPDKPIHLVVPFSPGGGSDLLARLIAEPLSQRLGQTVIVDNKPGANAAIGADFVAKAPADGYTLLYTPPGPQITNPSLMAKLPYDPAKDLVPVVRLGVFVAVLVVHPSVPANNVRELIAYAKANPGILNFSSPGVASANHLGGEYLKARAGIDIVHVPYKGSAPALQDLLSGRVQMTIDTLAVLLPHIRSGALRPIAVAALERSPSLVDVPTLAETIENFDASSLSYISVPAGTPPLIIERLNREVNAILTMPNIRARLLEMGVATSPSTQDDIKRQVESEHQKWKKVIDAAGVKPG
jgi:tripartite-type tricarboxylate transporter receptor subunit TctC